MKKTFHINEKILGAKYNRRIFLFNLPSISLILSLLVIVFMFYVLADDNISIPNVIYKSTFYGLYFCTAYSFIVCLVGSILSDMLIRSHKQHTYIEISDSCLIISEHCQTVFCDGKLRSYKKLWIIDLKDVENVECLKNHIIITAKARYFNENADWLGYEKTENGVDFDNWWYNSNGGKIVQTVDITDYYTYGTRIAKRIRFCSEKIIERTERREQFRREMLEIAKNTKHQKGISDKYIPPEQRRFR